MNTPSISRRALLQQSGAVLTGLALLNAGVAHAFPVVAGEEVIAWLDQPPENADPYGATNLLPWEEMTTWLTPNDQFFGVIHYEWPTIEEKDWQLEITGLVKRPLTFTLAELKARSRKETIFTLECSGNHGFDWFISAIGNAKWAGTPLAPILREAGVQENGIEIVFFGSDVGEEELGGQKVKQNFARSMSLTDAMNPNNLLCYEMNGESLPQAHGFPLRLIAPGWYGIANVKWLKRIEVRNTRFMSRFMARDYVTLRKEEHNGETVWAETSVGRMLLKSVPARVIRQDGNYRIQGAAWGAPIQRVEVRIDNGTWVQAQLDTKQSAQFAWKFWQLDWKTPPRGEHAITSRAVDTQGNVQPAADDPRIANKLTYWESNGQVTRRVRIG